MVIRKDNARPIKSSRPSRLLHLLRFHQLAPTPIEKTHTDNSTRWFSSTQTMSSTENKETIKKITQQSPINYYGLSKLEAEKAVKQICKDYIIARPSVIYSWVLSTQIQASSGKPPNFAIWLTQKLEKNEAVNIVTDQYSLPTLADSLAETI